MLPPVPVAIQNTLDKQLMLLNDPEGIPVVVFQAPAPPVGLVEVRRVLPLATTAQKEEVGQEIPTKMAVPSISVLVQVGVLEEGLVVVRRFPLASTAAQKLVDGHETPKIT
jgi:hypothetical protein